MLSLINKFLIVYYIIFIFINKIDLTLYSDLICKIKGVFIFSSMWNYYTYGKQLDLINNFQPLFVVIKYASYNVMKCLFLMYKLKGILNFKERMRI